MNNVPMGQPDECEATADCPVCQGKGKTEWQDEITDCDDCEGTGLLPENYAFQLAKDMRMQSDADNQEREY